MRAIIFFSFFSLFPMLSSTTSAQNLRLSVNQIFSSEQDISISIGLGDYYYGNDSFEDNADSIAFNLYRPEQQEAFLIDVVSGGENIQLNDSLVKNSTYLKSWEKIVPNDGWEDNSVSIGKLEPGIYIIEALYESQVGRLPILVSDYALITKKKGEEIISFVANMNTGKQQSGFEVFRVQEKNLIQANSKTNGLSIFNLADTERYYKLIAKFENQLTASHFYYYSYRESDSQLGLLFTDRPAYKPGQEVFFQGFIRNSKGYDLFVSKDTFSIKIYDERNEEVYNKKLICDEKGSFNDSLLLKENASLGKYTITASINERETFGYYSQSVSGYFRVEEYKKPEYEVNIDLDKTQYVSGDTIKAKIKANYFFGAPVKNATVNYRIVRELYYVPWYAYYSYSWWYDDVELPAYYNNSELIENNSAQLNEDGTLDITFATNGETIKNYRYKVLVDVTDASRRSIASSASVLVTATTFTFTLNAEKFYYNTDDEVVVRVNAADFAKQPVESAFSFNVKKYTNSEEVPKPIYSTNGKTDKNGFAVLRFNIEEPGYYQLEVKALDKNNKEVTSNASVYILKEGQNAYSWWNNQSAEIQIITDKKVYEAGDTLKAMIMAPNATDALVTLDGKAIIHKKIQPFNTTGEDTFTEYEIPLSQGLYGNMHLDVAYISKGKTYNRGEKITVIPTDKYLNVSLTFDEQTYKPGNVAEATVTIKDAKNNPVPNALLSLATADESIYFLYPDKTSDIRKSFYPNTSTQSYTYINSYTQSHQGKQVAYTYLKSLMESGKFKPKGKFFVPTNSTYLFKMGNYNEIQNKVSGYVIDQKSGALLKGVKVQSGNAKTKTDEWGYYELLAPSGTDISFSYKKGAIIFTDAYFMKEKSAGFREVYLNVKLDYEKKEKQQISLNDPMYYSRNMLFDDEPAMAEMAFAADDDDWGDSGSDQDVNFTSLRTKSARASSRNEVSPVVRQNFKDAIYWNPQVTTNAQGQATVKITLPDNLTTWRTTAKVITSDSKVGQSFAKILVKKDLLLRMETPRFFRTGDQLLIATTVHNYLNKRKRVRVALKANGITVKGTSKYIYIPAGGEQRVDWQVNVKWPGNAILTAEAVTNEESDAKKVSVPVEANGLEVISAHSAVLKQSNQETLELFIPKEVDLNTVSVEMSTAPSVAAALLGSLDQLIGYPYGCVEQTMSRFLPTLIVANTLKQLQGNYTSGISDSELQKMTAQGLTRLGELQHYDGGWGWWETDDTHPFMTAYVVNGLSLAEKTGYAIPKDMLTQGKIALSNMVRVVESPEATTYAYQAMTVMQAGITELWAELAKPNVDRLDAYQTALWLQAAQLANDTTLTSNLLARLEQTVIKDGNNNYWGGKKFYYSWQNDQVETTAQVVKALAEVDTQHPLISGAIQWLMQKRRGNGWHNTRQTAFTILGLQKVIASEIDPDYTLTVLANGKKVIDTTVKSADVFKKAHSITLRSEQFTASTKAEFQAPTGVLKHGKNIFTVAKQGKGTTYANATLTYFLKKGSKSITDVKNSGISVERNYFTLKPQSDKTGKIIYRKTPLSESTLVSGNDVLVKVKISSEEDLDYVLIEDPIAAGFEFIRDKSGYNIEDEEAYNGGDYYRSYFRWMNQAHTEYRDNRYAIVLTRLYKGVYEYSYIIKAQIPGTFEVNPAVVQLMYYPEKRGFSSFEEINIKTQD